MARKRSNPDVKPAPEGPKPTNQPEKHTYTLKPEYSLYDKGPSPLETAQLLGIDLKNVDPFLLAIERDRRDDNKS